MLKNSNLKQRILLITLIISTLLMIIKFLAYFITNSDAILTDALESIVNVTAGAFALFSITVASQPKDRTHPYGHGKIEFISAGIEGGLIVAAGLGMIGKAIYSFIVPHPIDKIDVGLGLTVFSTLVNYAMGYYLIVSGKKYDSITLIADGKHIQSDAYSSLGLIFGLAGMYFSGWLWLDGVLTVIFALLIIFTGYHLIREAVSGVMDEADEKLLGEVIDILNQNRQTTWIDFHNLRIIKYGHALHIDSHLTLPWYWDLQQAHTEGEKVASIIDQALDAPLEIFIHIDPCVPTSCRICTLEDCAVRKFAFEKRLDWNLNNILNNQKHEIVKE
ncbi:MAG: cation diffusion facilitator family transporter [Microscillaceae bacterium]|jgi:cation diffusion facilitator family transporter|nr:cation diffusion facilitator family transporter [Microscillaceae bacterium]